MRFTWGWFLTGLLLGFAPVAIADDGQAIVVRPGSLQPVQIQTLDLPDALQQNSRSLLIWSEAGVDRWLIGETDPTSDGTAASRGFSLRQTGVDGQALAGPAGGLTQSLDQIFGQLVIRGEGFLTPRHAGRHLQGKITIRRQPEPNGVAFPQAKVSIIRAGQSILDVPFAEGVATLAWSELENLPQPFLYGLPPGEYSIRYADGSGNTGFRIDDSETREWVLARANILAEWLGTANHPLVYQVMVEEMLHARDETDQPSPYLADALDFIEGIAEADRSAYLREQHANILERLGGKASLAVIDQPTGIEAIDQARRLIAQNRWQAAQQKLKPLTSDTTPTRTRGLAWLYTAVVLSESGADVATADNAQQVFQAALQELSSAESADRFRAHNNYANFLLLCAQDQLYNHAFQAASGVRHPLLKSVTYWHQAHQQYLAAMEQAAELPDSQQAAAEVNLARAYCLLADILDSLCEDPAELAMVGHARVVAAAQRLATAALGSQPDWMTRGAAAEILSHLAFRNGDLDNCRRHTLDALEAYYQCGNLAGVESGFRTLGMTALRGDSTEPSTEPSSEPSADPLNRLMVSQLLTEILRERVPADQSGQSRAGYFARRAYVNEQLVGLLIQRGDARQALAVAELGKARALQDVLISARLAAGAAEHNTDAELEDVLADWPEGVVGLEYFLGTRSGWGFVVDRDGVQAFPLCDLDGKPVVTQQLVRELAEFLQGMNFTARRMLTEYQAEGRFDSD